MKKRKETTIIMTPDEFIDWLAPSATKVCSEYNLPSSVLIAQGAIESGWGKYIIGNYNVFGRKWNGTGEYTTYDTMEYGNDGQWYGERAKFQSYTTLEEACEDWCILMTQEPLYNQALYVWNTTKDINAFIREMAPVYATDPDYADKIIGTIRANELERYDN